MSFDGHVENGEIVLEEAVSLPDGTKVRVELVAACPPSVVAAECFSHAPGSTTFDPKALDSMRAQLTPEQFAALSRLASRGGLDVEAIGRLRAASVE